MENLIKRCKGGDASPVSRPDITGQFYNTTQAKERTWSQVCSIVLEASEETDNDGQARSKAAIRYREPRRKIIKDCGHEYSGQGCRRDEPHRTAKRILLGDRIVTHASGVNTSEFCSRDNPIARSGIVDYVPCNYPQVQVCS